jgi:hypothetical protein
MDIVGTYLRSYVLAYLVAYEKILEILLKFHDMINTWSMLRQAISFIRQKFY